MHVGSSSDLEAGGKQEQRFEFGCVSVFFCSSYFRAEVEMKWIRDIADVSEVVTVACAASNAVKITLAVRPLLSNGREKREEGATGEGEREENGFFFCAGSMEKHKWLSPLAPIFVCSVCLSLSLSLSSSALVASLIQSS